MASIKAKEIEEVVVDENGNETVQKSIVNSMENKSIAEHSEYARFFDELCPDWQKDPEYNLMFLRHMQNFATDKLRSKGHLFLNEVYDMLGIPRTKAGQVVGWIYDEKNPNGDNYVDFGIFNSSRADNRRFVNGCEPVIIIDPNVDGEILNKFWEERVIHEPMPESVKWTLIDYYSMTGGLLNFLEEWGFTNE